MLVFDTNVLVYAIDEDSPFHEPCRARVVQAREGPSPAFVTWSICYESGNARYTRMGVIGSLPRLRNLAASADQHDLLAVLMREHGVSRICTRDTDFHRFPSLSIE